jgi:hypothetical protein
MIRGKLSCKQENMEDILTSNVFGLLQYVTPELGLFPFLAEAETISGDHPLAGLVSNATVEVGAVDYRFWPRWQGCEPDVVIHIPRTQGLPFLIGIEAKYRSGKSSRTQKTDDGPDDQLAREWRDLVAEAKDRNAQPVLVYLTADFCFPKDQMESSLAECGESDAFLPSRSICWLSWRQLPRLFKRHLDPVQGRSDRILHQLASLIGRRLGLTFFEGIRNVPRIEPNWAFDRGLPAGVS